jgi:hypothetical protein
MLRICICMHSHFIENHPIWILEDGPLISEMVLSQLVSELGSGLNTQSKHLKNATMFMVMTLSPNKDYSSLLRWQANCVYILQLWNCVSEGMLWFLECSSYYLVDDLIFLFVALIELLGLAYAFFSVYEIIWLFVLSCRTLM